MAGCCSGAKRRRCCAATEKETCCGAGTESACGCLGEAAAHPTRRSQSANTGRYDRIARIYRLLKPGGKREPG